MYILILAICSYCTSTGTKTNTRNTFEFISAPPYQERRDFLIVGAVLACTFDRMRTPRVPRVPRAAQFRHLRAVSRTTEALVLTAFYAQVESSSRALRSAARTQRLSLCCLVSLHAPP